MPILSSSLCMCHNCTLLEVVQKVRKVSVRVNCSYSSLAVAVFVVLEDLQFFTVLSFFTFLCLHLCFILHGYCTALQSPADISNSLLCY